MTCKFCGQEIDSGMQFCPNCGNLQNDPAQQSAQEVEHYKEQIRQLEHKLGDSEKLVSDMQVQLRDVSGQRGKFSKSSKVLLFATGILVVIVLLMGKSNAELVTQQNSLENSLSQVEADYNDLEDTYGELKNFMDKHIALIEDDGTDLYHTYDCEAFLGEAFWAYNKEAAESKGYDPCPDCH